MSAPHPIKFVAQDDGSLVPANYWWGRQAQKEFPAGETITVSRHEFRSGANHRHQFAWVREAWDNLPDHYRDEPWAKSPEHLRKFALVMRGYCSAETFPCETDEEAERWAARIKPLDEYVVVKVSDNVVHRFTAKSQSVQAMGAQEFNASKRAILDFIANLIGVDADTLERQEEPA